MLRCTIILSTLLLTAVNVRAQCERPVVGENRVLVDESANFPDGVTVSFRCSTGYVRASGSRSITCTGTQWSELELQCKKRSCGNPGDITNGKYQYPQGVEFGATITAVCNKGIEGKSPPYKYNNILRYQCNKGYKIEGSDFLTCKEDGWDPHPPQCTVITCLTPPAIVNGLFDPLKELYEYRQTVTYSCNEGFRLSGASTIACSDDGTFQTSPQCVEITCDLPFILNAHISGRMP
ncbi:hypothetical protein PDJAM_G00076010 [Pangasius djambal]|uniref:Uncharacterized protein n=1 Tax=Pangasius djambal TaxID=1691987 RepID=A0ACC5Z174_9TELE|nr:hypothetical protein [Pangasius djambal]